MIFQIFPLDRVSVILYDAKPQALYPKASKTREEQEETDGIGPSQTVVRKVVDEKIAFLAKDTYLDERRLPSALFRHLLSWR